MIKNALLVTAIALLTSFNCFSQFTTDPLASPANLSTNMDKQEMLRDSNNLVQNTHTPDSVYIKRLSALPFEFNMTFNPTVKRYIELYTVRIKDKMQVLLGLSNFYFPFFEELLRENQLPDELKYISIIESALNPKAVSSARAIGLWQFMKGTGRENGLIINSYVDQRKGIVESTKAATLYLKRLYSMYHDWHLVLAAYNCGPGRVNRAIARSGGKRDFWKIYKYLPRQTRGYVPEFIGAAYAFIYFKEHNIIPVPSLFPLQTDTIKISKNLHFNQVSDVLGISLEDLRQINTQYIKDIIPGSDKNQYSLRVPLEFKMKFHMLEDSIYSYKAAFYEQLAKVSYKETNEVIHVVRSGESLSIIARRYHVSLASIKRGNHLSGDFIRKGQRLIISE